MKMQLLVLSLVLAIAPLARAEQASFLYKDRDALQARADLIQQAKREILMEYFSVTDDNVSNGLITLLCDASKRGVKVRVLLDDLSSKVKGSTMEATKDICKDKFGNTNIQFRLFNPWWDLTSIHDIMNRTHEKVLAVDGEVMITGGRNLDGKYFGLDKVRNFKDLDIIIGGEVVKTTRNYFIKIWNKMDIVKSKRRYQLDKELLSQTCEKMWVNACDTRIENLETLLTEDLINAKKMLRAKMASIRSGKNVIKINTGKDWLAGSKSVSNVRLLTSSPDKNIDMSNKGISDELYTLFENAKKSVLILSPYLIPTKRAEKLFRDLIARGVTVTVITNSLKSTDNLFAQAGFKVSKKPMIEMGVELYEYNLHDTAHAKAAVIDDEIVLIGTYNMDPRSAQINRELGLVINDPDSGLAHDLTKIINRFKSESLLVGMHGKERNLHLQNKDVSSIKKGTVEIISPAVPLIRNQL